MPSCKEQSMLFFFGLKCLNTIPSKILSRSPHLEFTVSCFSKMLKYLIQKGNYKTFPLFPFQHQIKRRHHVICTIEGWWLRVNDTSWWHWDSWGDLQETMSGALGCAGCLDNLEGCSPLGAVCPAPGLWWGRVPQGGMVLPPGDMSCTSWTSICSGHCSQTHWRGGLSGPFNPQSLQLREAPD